MGPVRSCFCIKGHHPPFLSPAPFLSPPSSSHLSTLNKQLPTSPSSQKMVVNKRGASSEARQGPKKIVAGSRKRIMEVINSDAEGEPQRKVRCRNVLAKARNNGSTGTHFQKPRISSIALDYRVLLRMTNSRQCIRKPVRSTRKKVVKMNLVSRMLRSTPLAA